MIPDQWIGGRKKRNETPVLPQLQKRIDDRQKDAPPELCLISETTKDFVYDSTAGRGQNMYLVEYGAVVHDVGNNSYDWQALRLP